MEVSFREPVRHITTQMLDIFKQLESKVDMERDHALAVTNQVSILKISNQELALHKPIFLSDSNGRYLIVSSIFFLDLLQKAKAMVT